MFCIEWQLDLNTPRPLKSALELFSTFMKIMDNGKKLSGKQGTIMYQIIV